MVLVKDIIWLVAGIALFIVAAVIGLPEKLWMIPVGMIGWIIPAVVMLWGGARLAYHQVLYTNAKYLITNNKIQRESGIVTKNIELVELYKITDLGYNAILGRGVITMHSTDVTSPTIKICVPNGRTIFEQIQKALPDARERSNVGMRLEVG